jgi:hypothetical protein
VTNSSNQGRSLHARINKKIEMVCASTLITMVICGSLAIVASAEIAVQELKLAPPSSADPDCPAVKVNGRYGTPYSGVITSTQLIIYQYTEQLHEVSYAQLLIPLKHKLEMLANVNTMLLIVITISMQ